jgi:hypothetical protein
LLRAQREVSCPPKVSFFPVENGVLGLLYTSGYIQKGGSYKVISLFFVEKNSCSE